MGSNRDIQGHATKLDAQNKYTKNWETRGTPFVMGLERCSTNELGFCKGYQKNYSRHFIRRSLISRWPPRHIDWIISPNKDALMFSWRTVNVRNEWGPKLKGWMYRGWTNLKKMQNIKFQFGFRHCQSCFWHKRHFEDGRVWGSCSEASQFL